MRLDRKHRILSPLVALAVGLVCGLLVFSLFDTAKEPVVESPEQKAKRLTALASDSSGIISRTIDGSEPLSLHSIARLVSQLERIPDAELGARLDQLTLSSHHRDSKIIQRIVAEILVSRGDEFVEQWMVGFQSRPGNGGIAPLGVFGEIVTLRPALIEAVLAEVNFRNSTYMEMRDLTERIASLTDSNEAIGLILRKPAGQRSQLLEGYMAGLQASDPGKAWALFKRLTNEFPPSVTGRWSFADEVIAQHPDQVVSEFLDKPERHQLVKTGLAEWGEAEPADAIEFYLANELWKRGSQTLEYFSEGLMNTNNIPSIRAALEQLESAPTGRANYQISGNLAIALMFSDPDGVNDATEVLRQIPLGQTRDTVMDELTWRLSGLDNAELSQKITQLQSSPEGTEIAESVIEDLRSRSASRLARLGLE